MSQNSSPSIPPVSLKATQDSQPVPPPWFAQATVLATWFWKTAVVLAIQKNILVPRGRSGRFTTTDLLLAVLLYAVSNEHSLKDFFIAATPWRTHLAGLWNREVQPSRSAFSRFLADVPDDAVASLRALFFQNLLQHGLQGPLIGGVSDRSGRRHIVFDVDGTRQAARQRSLVAGADYPPARRRFDTVCRPGYTGRKRGEVVRTRSVAQQAHSREWLGTWGAPGNGEGWADLVRAGVCIGDYMDHHSLPRSVAVVRLDGLYGHIPPVAGLQAQGLGYLTRCCDYAMLEDPLVKAAIAAGPVETFLQPDTGTLRELFDLPVIRWHAADHSPIHTRMIVARTHRKTDEPFRIGRRSPKWTDELFVTSLSSEGWCATDVLELYFGRGAFEGTLAHDDAEQLADRWCSHHPAGQELWQVIHQWVWNLRIWLGRPEEAEVQRTEFSPARGESATPEEPPVPFAPPPPPPRQPVDGAPEEWKPPGEVARAFGKGAARFGGKDFCWKAGKLYCPAGKVLRRKAQEVKVRGLRLTYQASAGDCVSCTLREQCLGTGKGLDGRKVSVWKYPDPPAVPPERPPSIVPPAQLGKYPIIWSDVPAQAWRRVIHHDLRLQRVDLVEVPPEPRPPRLITRAERAHRRQTWAQRERGNVRRTRCPWEIHLHGVPPQICKWLDSNKVILEGG